MNITICMAKSIVARLPAIGMPEFIDIRAT